MSDKPVVHLYKESVFEDEERVGYSACGVVVHRSYYKTTNLTKSTQVAENVTCGNCKRTDYYQERIETPNPIEDVTQKIEEAVEIKLDKTMLEKVEEELRKWASYLGTPEGRKWASRIMLLIVIIGIIFYIL